MAQGHGCAPWAIIRRRAKDLWTPGWGSQSSPADSSVGHHRLISWPTYTFPPDSVSSTLHCGSHSTSRPTGRQLLFSSHSRLSQQIQIISPLRSISSELTMRYPRLFSHCWYFWSGTWFTDWVLLSSDIVPSEESDSRTTYFPILIVQIQSQNTTLQEHYREHYRSTSFRIFWFGISQLAVGHEVADGRRDSKAKRETRIFLGSGRPYRVSSRWVSSFSSAGGIFLRLREGDNLQSRISSPERDSPASAFPRTFAPRETRPIVLLRVGRSDFDYRTVESDIFSLFSPDFAPAFDRLTSPSWKRENSDPRRSRISTGRITLYL